MKESKTFGQTLRFLRESKNMSLRELSTLLDIHQSTLSKTERDERKPHALLIKRASKFFKISEEELIITSLSDRLSGELKGISFAADILKATERKLKYFKNRQC